MFTNQDFLWFIIDVSISNVVPLILILILFDISITFARQFISI